MCFPISTALALSRQNLPQLATDPKMADSIRKGGYILSDIDNPQVIIIGTGSETHMAMEAQALLASAGIAARVVSMPCTNVFDRQSEAYQNTVIPMSLPAIAIEAAHPDFWRKYVGRSGVVIGISTFGESAPAKDLYQHFGISTQRIVEAAKTLVHRAAHMEVAKTNDSIVRAYN